MTIEREMGQCRYCSKWGPCPDHDDVGFTNRDTRLLPAPPDPTASALEAAQQRIQVLERDISRLDELWSAATVRALEAEKNQSFLDEAVTGACKDRDYFSAQLEAAEARLSTQQERIKELEAAKADYNNVEEANERLEARLSTLTQRVQQYEELIDWVLGQHPTDEFPPLPDDWPSRKFYWRNHLRQRLSSLLVEGETPEKPQDTER